MLRNAAVSRIQRGLGFRTDKETEIISALQEAQRQLEKGRTLPWFLLQEGQTLSVTSGNQSVNLPTGYLRVYEDDTPHFTSTENGLVYLVNKPLDEGDVYYADYEAGEPVAYTIRSTSVKVWPVPDANYSLTWSYYKAATELTSDIENSWLANVPELLIGAAGAIIAADLRDAQAVSTFASMYQMSQDWLNREIAAREQQGRTYAMGRNN